MGRIRSRAAVEEIHLEADFLALKASLSNSDEEGAELNNPSETSLTSLRRCLAERAVLAKEAKRCKPRGKTSCSIWKSTSWMRSMETRSRLLLAGQMCAKLARVPKQNLALLQLLAAVVAARVSRP